MAPLTMTKAMTLI